MLLTYWHGRLSEIILLADRQQEKCEEMGARSRMLHATHGLWMERNNLMRLLEENGIRELNKIALQTAVSQQCNLGYEGLEEEYFYLPENGKNELTEEPVEMIRGWLCEVMIARGDLASDRLESLTDRG